jgi:hypothetical protein
MNAALEVVLRFALFMAIAVGILFLLRRFTALDPTVATLLSAFVAVTVANAVVQYATRRRR